MHKGKWTRTLEKESDKNKQLVKASLKKSEQLVKYTLSLSYYRVSDF